MRGRAATSRPPSGSASRGEEPDDVDRIRGPGLGGVPELRTERLVLRQWDVEAHFTPAIEVGWRVARAHWGRGYATEAAKASLDFGFRELHLAEIVAMIAPANARSRAVAERLGMSRDPADDFNHPRIPAGPLRRHAFYRMKR